MNPREGDKAIRAVVMVMPFPNAGPFPVDYSGQTNLFGLLGTIFSSLISQARFKPEELTLADDPDVYSRFLIVPRRKSPEGSPASFPIACGSLDGFGGFLSRRFREHDYQLGRCNCQRFLKQHFALPAEGDDRNKLFDHWTEQARARHLIVQKHTTASASLEGQDELKLLPIIPLMGTAALDVPMPIWPTYLQSDLDTLRPRVKGRLGRVVGALIDQNIQAFFWGPLARFALKSAWWFMGGKVVDGIIDYIKNNLKTMGLMR